MWIVVVIMFLSGSPVDSKILAAKSEQACEEGRTEVAARATAQGLDLWISDCIEVPPQSKFHKERDS